MSFAAIVAESLGQVNSALRNIPSLTFTTTVVVQLTTTVVL